jgi:YhcH/YjgK/YiaL family protein
MIFDHINNAGLYATLSPGLSAAFDYLRSTDFTTIVPGRYDIDAENVFALVSQYATKPRASGKLEAHRRYIDVQYLALGRELLGFAPIGLCEPKPYDDAKDCLFLAGPVDFLPLQPGMFAVFFPHDAHMPGIAVAAPEPVKKIVVKVAVGHID